MTRFHRPLPTITSSAMRIDHSCLRQSILTQRPPPLPLHLSSSFSSSSKTLVRAYRTGHISQYSFLQQGTVNNRRQTLCLQKDKKWTGARHSSTMTEDIIDSSRKIDNSSSGDATSGMVQKRKPITPGLRHKRTPSRAMLWKGGPFKPLTIGVRQKGGRNEHGHITTRRRGGGHKQRYRIIDWRRNKSGPHEVLRLEYDPNRSAHIALMKRQACGTLSYILCPHGVKPGDILQSGQNIPIERGNRVKISECPSGTIVHALAYRPNERAKIARAAGTIRFFFNKSFYFTDVA